MDTGVIRFGPEVCHNLESALRREWLETNGLGGFSSSTIIGLNTRRYHGLLTAATKPPVGRMVLLSKLEECVIIGGERYDLSANRYPGVIHPQGHRCLKEFRLDPFPVFTFEVNGVEIEKRVFYSSDFRLRRENASLKIVCQFRQPQIKVFSRGEANLKNTF